MPFELAAEPIDREIVTMIDTWFGGPITIGVYCAVTGNAVDVMRIDLVATRVDTGA
ncbi:MAG: hypothetical protein ACRD0A_13940 [Acidimicrobiales bacterium]